MNRFENVDVLAALEQLMRQNTAFYRNDFEIDKEIPLENGTVRVASEEDDEEMDDTDYLIGFDLDVDKLIYREILVNWPMKVLCKEDCKGICKVCGHNLNEGDCGCQRTELDPRMAAIQDVFNKFKEV